jgi:hypothetical protein
MSGQKPPVMLTIDDVVVKSEEISTQSSPRIGKIGMMTPLIQSRKRHAVGQGLPSMTSSTPTVETPSRRELTYSAVVSNGGTKRKQKSPQQKTDDMTTSKNNAKQPSRKKPKEVKPAALSFSAKEKSRDTRECIIEIPPGAKVGDRIEIREWDDNKPLPKPIAITIPPSFQTLLSSRKSPHSFQFEFLKHIIECFEQNKPFKKEFNAKIIIQDSGFKLTPPPLKFPGT